MSSKKSKSKLKTKTDPVVQQEDQLETYFHFVTPIYKMNNTKFLKVVREVAEEHAVEIRAKGIDEIYPVVQTTNMNDDPRVLDFGNYVAQTAWNILESQGYAMQNFTTHFSEMWMQEHYKHSAMEEHSHKGVAIVGFYILEVPENSSRAVFYDPRPGKVMASTLPEADMMNATIASDMINFELKPGDLILTNNWLPHSFTRHAAEEPIRFIHFNVFVQPVFNAGDPQMCPAPAEVI